LLKSGRSQPRNSTSQIGLNTWKKKVQLTGEARLSVGFDRSRAGLAH
jgi:hypothetical protein